MKKKKTCVLSSLLYNLKSNHANAESVGFVWVLIPLFLCQNFSMWIKFNSNPKLLTIDDCTVRALSVATRRPWRVCYTMLANEGRELGLMMDDKAVFGKVLKDAGFHKVLVPEDCPVCFTIKDFCRQYPKGIYIVATNNHVVAVIDGDYYDTFDSGDETPIYYWRADNV